MEGSGPRPVIIAVDDDPASIRRIGDELERRYGHDYRIIASRTPTSALAQLERMYDAADPVALILADVDMAEIGGSELLAQARRLHPHAKRVLLIPWGGWADPGIAGTLRRAMTDGDIDHYVPKPWRQPDELFHRTLTDLLHEWTGGDPTVPREITVVAEARSARGHELRSLLTRNGVPHAFWSSDSPEGSRALRAAGRERTREPVVLLLDGRVLVDPSNAELAKAYGATTELPEGSVFDVVVIGAGPAGLAAAVYASSEGLSVLVVEREAVGGQAGSSARIRNYLGFPRGLSGADLAERAYRQAWLFGTTFLLMRPATGLRVDHTHRVVTLEDDTEIRARCVVLATGVTYRTLDVPALSRLQGLGVFYGSAPGEAPLYAGGRAFIVGAGNSAGQAAVHLSRYAERVTIVARGESLGDTMSQYLRDEIAAAANVDVLLRTRLVDAAGSDRLERVTLEDADGVRREEPADALFILIGARPNTGWLPAEVVRDVTGFVVTDQPPTDPAHRSPFLFETSLAGVFAVGDVRAASVKRVASAAGEGSVVIQQVHSYLEMLQEEGITS